MLKSTIKLRSKSRIALMVGLGLLSPLLATSWTISRPDVALAATVDKVLTSSGVGTNRGLQWSLKEYAVNMSRYNANGGALKYAQGYDNRTTACTHPASMPWLPANGGIDAALGEGALGYPTYSGDDLSTKGDCHNRYTDGGVDSGAWLPPSYLNWTLPGTLPGFGVVAINSSVNADCQALRGGGAPLISAVNTHTVAMTDQAYGSGGIFSTIWGASPPSGTLSDVRLYSYGTGLIRNQFTISAEDYAMIDPSRGGASVYLFARGDDWINMYVNGVAVGSTSTITGSVVRSVDLNGILREGVNVIAVQVHDKAHWRTSGVIDATTGACYNLTAILPSETTVSPKVSISGGGVAFAGEEVTATAQIVNDGGRAGLVNWRRTLWYSNADSATIAPGDDILRDESGPGTLTVPIGGYDFTNWPEAISAGYSYICTRLQLTSASSDTRVSPASAHQCLAIGKKPHLEVSGGDIVSRGAGNIIYAPATSTATGLYGSWGEYGIFGSSDIDMYSGGSLMATLTPTPIDKAQLIFANTLTPLGSFADLGIQTMPTLPAWSSVSVGSSVAVNSLQDSRRNVRTGNLILSGGSNFTKSAILDVQGGWLRIDGNIEYANGPYSKLSDLPQLIIIADEIRIQPGVDRIDAWLIARNGLVTCGTNAGLSPYFSGLRRAVCNNKLTVNGPTQAGRLLPRRTAGAEGSSVSSRRQPAEVFNLRSDTYLWSYGQASRGDTIRTETVKELPPRF